MKKVRLLFPIILFLFSCKSGEKAGGSNSAEQLCPKQKLHLSHKSANQVEAEIWKLINAIPDTTAKLDALCKFAAEKYPQGDTGASAKTINTYFWTREQMLAETGSDTVFTCGSVARFYNVMCNYFLGLRTCELSIKAKGDTSDAGHVLAITEERINNKVVWTVRDPYTGITWHRADGSRIDLREIIKGIQPVAREMLPTGILMNKEICIPKNGITFLKPDGLKLYIDAITGQGIQKGKKSFSYLMTTPGWGPVYRTIATSYNEPNLSDAEICNRLPRYARFIYITFNNGQTTLALEGFAHEVAGALNIPCIPE